MDYLSGVIAIAEKAGKILATHFEKTACTAVTLKSDASPVTEADIAANHCIVAGLQALTPDLPIISEENDIVDFSLRQSWSTYWLVDPLDGTRGFIDKSREFCISIALIENHVPVLGVLYSPFQSDIFYGLKNKGAWRRSLKNNQENQLVTVKTTENSLRILCGHSRRNVDIQRLFETHFSTVNLRALHSALKFNLISAGEADVYVRFGPTSEWDTAGGQCILTEAGGTVVDFEGRPLQYNAKPSLINPAFLAVGDVSRLDEYLSTVRKFSHEKSH